MYTGAGAKKTARQDLDEAFAKSRGAAIVLAITAAFTGIQGLILFFSLPPDLLDLAAAEDEAALLQLGTLVYVIVFFLITLICMLFAWLMRSRIAMAVGLLIYGLNWLSFVIVLMEGGFDPTGILMNIIAPIFLVRSIIAASRYHSLRRAKPVDPDVFS